jgi:hypothetical protein
MNWTITSVGGRAPPERKTPPPSLEHVSKVTPRRLEEVPADEGAADGEKGLMHVGPSFVPDQQSAEAMQPCQRAFHDPARDAEAAAVRGATSAEDGDDAKPTKPPAMALGVVPTVALQHVRPAARPAPPAADAAERVDQRVELCDVVDVRRADLRYQGNAARIDDDVVFRALLTAIGWVRSSFFPPRNARSDALSTTAQRRSRRPRFRSSASKTAWSRRHTPRRCQWTRRRQHVLPDPHPISRGSICHGIPLRSTKRMPVSAARSDTRGRPMRPRGFGRSGSIRAHNWSSTRRLDRRMADRTKPRDYVQEPASDF